jgi:alkanesulfonate monooxygenase SsuD/methylene tetrahydromethanopterin reductase-like flavin-dependent oxidoreductase (luciferase family)
VKFGVACMLTDESISPTALATVLEERSFDSMFVGDHSHIPTSRETPFPFGGDLPREFDPFAALDTIWTRDVAEFHGTYLDFDPVFSWPKPVQAHVPVYVGGESTTAVRRAATLGDAWMPNSVLDPAQVEAQFALRDRYAAGTPLTAYAVSPTTCR